MLAGSGRAAWGLTSRGRSIAAGTLDYCLPDAGKFCPGFRGTGAPVGGKEFQTAAHGLTLRRRGGDTLSAKGALTLLRWSLTGEQMAAGLALLREILVDKLAIADSPEAREMAAMHDRDIEIAHAQ